MVAVPYIDLISSHSCTGHDWVKLVGRTIQTDFDRVTVQESLKITALAVERAYPSSTLAQRERALRMCFTLLVTQLALLDPASAEAGSKENLDLSLLIDFLSGGSTPLCDHPSRPSQPSSRPERLIH